MSEYTVDVGGILYTGTISYLEGILSSAGATDAQIAFLLAPIYAAEEAANTVVDTVTTVTETLTQADILAYIYSAEGLASGLEAIDQYVVNAASAGIITVDQYFQIVSEWVDYIATQTYLQGLLDTITNIEGYTTVIQDGVTYVQDAAGNIIGQIGEMGDLVGDTQAIVDAIAAELTSMQDQITSLTDTINQFTQNVTDQSAILDGINQVITDITETLGGIPQTIADAIKGFQNAEQQGFLQRIGLIAGLVVGGLVLYKGLDVVEEFVE